MRNYNVKATEKALNSKKLIYKERVQDKKK